MKTIPELIKIGLEWQQANRGETYMCFVLSDLANGVVVGPPITWDEYRSFKNWLWEKLHFRGSASVLTLLERVGLDDSEENWVQFYVWAYYDLIKRNTHEHQP